MSKLDFFESFQPTQRDSIQDIGTSSKSFLQNVFFFGTNLFSWLWKNDFKII